MILSFSYNNYDFRYQLLHSEDLLKAFQALDTESKGYLSIDEAKNFFTRHGEAFAQVCPLYLYI